MPQVVESTIKIKVDAYDGVVGIQFDGVGVNMEKITPEQKDQWEKTIGEIVIAATETILETLKRGEM